MSDLADASEGGYCSTYDVALQIFGTAIDRDKDLLIHAMRCVGIRMAWMKRYGVVEKNEKKHKSWKLTPTGEALLDGTLGKTQESALEKVKDTQLLHLATAISERYVTADDIGATMMRRAWQYGTHRRRGW